MLIETAAMRCVQAPIRERGNLESTICQSERELLLDGHELSNGEVDVVG